MKRFLFWLSVAIFVASNLCFWITSSKFVSSISGLIAGLSVLYIIRRLNLSVEAKIEAARVKAFAPIAQPDYTPKLFGAAMEWDPESGIWLASFGAIDVELEEVRDDRKPGSWDFTWRIESTAVTGLATLAEACQELERELTRTRNAIPVATAWSPS